MESISISKKIRDLRKQLDLTQKDLADGVCTQAQISNIEKGELSPSSLILYKISVKLNVDMNYFFDIENYSEHSHVASIKELIRKYIRQRDYKSLEYIISNEQNNPLFKTKENQQFLLWHEAICEYYLKKGTVQRSIDKLEQAITLTYVESENYNEREIEILNSIAIIYTEEKNYFEAAKIYKTCLKDLDLLSTIDSKNIKIRVIYGLTKCLTDMENFEESLLYCKIGKELCVENETLYLLGELLYQLGENLIKLKRFESGNEYLDKATSLFEIQNNFQFIEIINQEREKLTLIIK